jgi:hypothetical protein
MKKYIFLVLIALLIFNLGLLVKAQEPPPEIPEGFTFYRYQYAYFDISLIYPEQWINQSSQEIGISISLPDYQGTISFTATPLFGEKYTLTELWEENMKNLTGAVFLESAPDLLSGFPAKRTIFTMKFGDQVLKFIIYNILVNDLYYSFNFSTKEAEFGKYLSEVIKVARSIKINK